MVEIGVASKYLGVTPKTLRVWEDKDGNITIGDVSIRVYRTKGRIRRYAVIDLEILRQAMT